MKIKTSQFVPVRLTAVSLACLLVSCSGDGRTDDPTDGTADATSDVVADSMADTGADSGPTRCEDAPTARLSASPLDSDKNVQAAQTETIEVTPLTDFFVGADESITQENRSIGRVKWEIEQRPEFALATFGLQRLRRSDERPIWLRTNQKYSPMQVGLAGDYTVSLTVWNDEGTISCNSAELTVQVRPESELYVEFKYPYERVRSDDYPGEYNYNHTTDTPYLNFAFKRARDARWSENMNDVIPNARSETGVQDWGTQGDDADDPRWTDISRDGASNAFVQLDGVESDTSYFSAVSMSRTPPETTPAIFSVYIDGERQLKHRRTLGQDHEAPFGMEILKIEKTDGTYDVHPLSNLYFNN